MDEPAVEIYHHLKSHNTLIALPDLFIAATAITHNLQLLTLNQEHFQRVTNLMLHPEAR
jgi:predicted nucleic acid-binding protein